MSLIRRYLKRSNLGLLGAEVRALATERRRRHSRRRQSRGHAVSSAMRFLSGTLKLVSVRALYDLREHSRLQCLTAKRRMYLDRIKSSLLESHQARRGSQV